MKSARKLIGAASPLEAEPGTIRGDLAMQIGCNSTSFTRQSLIGSTCVLLAGVGGRWSGEVSKEAHRRHKPLGG